jgi:PAS domain S-box-containing protein
MARNGRLIEVEIRSEPTRWKGHRARVDVVRELATEGGQVAQPDTPLFTGLVTTAHDGILALDDALVITWMNAAACQLFGVAEGGAVGKRLDQFIPAAYRHEYEALIRSRAVESATGDSPPTELLLLRANGDAFLAETGIARGVSGARPYIGMILRDRTQQREAEAALRDSERRYQLLASVAPVGIFRLDGEGRCIYVNERMGVIAGRGTAKLLGLGWAAIVHPDDRHMVLEEWSRALREKQSFHAEVRLVGVHNRERWVLVSARAEEDEEGAVRSYVGTVIDITRRRAAEAALRESEALYHTLASVAPVGIFRLSANGDCTFANDRAEAISGREGAGIRRSDWDDSVHPRDRDRVARAWQATIERDEPYQQEFRLRRPDGTWVRVLAGMVPERNASGRLVGFLGTLTDLTSIEGTTG